MQRTLLAVSMTMVIVSVGSAYAQERKAEIAQVPGSLYRMDARLQRQTDCKPPGSTGDPISLDGSGRYLDLVATRARPAYWGPDVDKVAVRNVPSAHEGELTDDLVLAIENGKREMSWALPANQGIDLARSQVMEVANSGLVQIAVKRHGVTVSTLWFIMRATNVILMDADGPIDSVYRSATVPAHLECDFELEFVPDPKAPAPPPVVVVPQLKTTSPSTNPKAPKPLAPIQVPPVGTVGVSWQDLNYLKQGEEQAVQLVVLKNGRASSVLWLTQKPREGGFKPLFTESRTSSNAAGGGAGASTPSTANRRIEVLLDRLGVVSPAFLNRRRPAYIPPSANDIDMVFTSLAPDRAFIVTFSGIPESERAELVRSGAQIGACSGGSCQAVIQVPSGVSAVIPLTPLRNAYTKGATTGSTVTFDVAFFDDDATPTNNHGYITFFDEPFFVESGSSTTWTGALSVSLLRDPDLTNHVPDGKQSIAITPDNPLDRTNRTHVSGSATAGLKQNLGSRADFEVEFTAKSGDLGQESSVKASKYLANVYTSYAATLTGGRFDVAAPTEAIAFSESGDALNAAAPVKLGYLGAGYVFRKQSAAGDFTQKKVQDAIESGAPQLDRNNRDFVLQWRDIAAGPVRSAVYGVVGDASRGRLRTNTDGSKELVPFDASAWSAGAETNVSVKHMLFSFGMYWSERSSEAPPEIKLTSDDADGSVWLAAYRYTNIDYDRLEGNQQASDFSVTARVGRGGAYVGENQAFAPDMLFLSKFAPLLDDPQSAIGPGLTNKSYYGVVFTTPHLTGGKGTATVQVHHYRLNEARGDSRNLGTEASIEFLLEQPKRIRYQLSFGGFQPGDALKASSTTGPLITKFQYIIKLGVTVRTQ